MPDLHLATRTARRRLRHPGCAQSPKRRARHFLARTDDDALALGVERGDVERQSVGNAQTVALPGCEVVDPAVLAEHAASRVDDLASRRADAVRLDELGDRASSDEADLHALGLVGVRQAA